MTSRIPHLLEPYLGLPDETALVVLTGVLGASTNWLVCRHLYSLLSPRARSPLRSLEARVSFRADRLRSLGEEGLGARGPHQGDGLGGTGNDEGKDEEEEEEAAVLFVSFLRDFAFWRESLARLGLDLEGAARRGRFGYVDGLGALFVPSSVPSSPAHSPSFPSHSTISAVGLQSRSPARQQQTQQQQQQQQQQHPHHHQQQHQYQRQQQIVGDTSGAGTVWKRVLTSAAPADIGRVILEAAEQLQTEENREILNGQATTTRGRRRRVVLVIDGLDFVLAASGPYPASSTSPSPSPSSGTAMALREMLMDLREKTHAVILTLAADDPLIKEQETPLERQHAWFALGLAHEADQLLSLRLLDTGAARDVSGVVRITHGDAHGATSQSRAGGSHEYLYHVGGDGSVRVFERGGQ